MSSAALGKALADAGISIKPAYVFSDPAHADAYRDYFRIGFGVAIMPKALASLQRFVEEHQVSWRMAKWTASRIGRGSGVNELRGTAVDGARRLQRCWALPANATVLTD